MAVSISCTARSKPTSTARPTMLWPMFSSSISGISATGPTFRRFSPWPASTRRPSLEAQRAASRSREILAQGTVDLIFLDEAMPGESGHELCRFVKQSLGAAAPKVVMLTAMEAQETWQEGLEAGADVFAVKPFGGERIRLLARNLLGEGV